jgi:predicted 2-oxoglutarate/Fe(II)-dependent dioxygenase YbiX
MVLQLSNTADYQGGDLKVYTDLSKDIYFPISRQQGSVSIFPSDFTHEVLEIIDGIRYTIVMWLESDNFDSNKKILI